MDLSTSEDSSLKDKSTMLGEEIDDVAACLSGIAIIDEHSDDGKVTLEKTAEGDSIQSDKLVEVNKQDHDAEKVGKNVEVDDSQSDELCKEEITQLDRSIEDDVTQSHRTDGLNDKENNLKELLQSVQCPFSWKLESDRSPDHVLSRTIEKMKEVEEEVSFQWRHFIFRLVLCYEYCRKNDIDSAFDELRRCEIFVNSSDSKGCYEELFQSIRNAMLHIVLACKCYLYLKDGNVDQAEKLASNICKQEEMDNRCKAALWGIKAEVSMEYGYGGTKDALDYVKKAMELDKEQGEWYFLFGKCLGRIRRIDNYSEIPTHEELKALEKAVNISRNSSYIIFLAQAYREAAFRVFCFNRYNLETALKNRIENMNKRSFELYTEALEMQGDCSHVNMRCAQGFYKLPVPYKDMTKARKCCDKALKLAPDNAMVHHTRGNIYESEHDYANARKHYEKSGELGAYGALMDHLKLEYKLDKSYNPIPKLECMLRQFAEKPRREETLSQMGSYYFFLKTDLPTAFEKYWRQIIEENPQSDKLKTHKCIFVYMQKPVDIYELLYDEARLALRTNDSTNSNDVKLLREIVLLCLDLFPDLDLNSPKPRRKMILDGSCNNTSRNTNVNRGGRRFQGQERRRERGETYNRNQNQGNERRDSNSSEGNRGRDSNTRYIPRNFNSNADSRPGLRFNRSRHGSSSSDWRAE